MNWCPAIKGVGGTVLIIRDNKVIGKGRASGMRGNEFVSITLIDEAARQLIPADLIDDVIGYKHTYLHYSPITGAFLGIYENDPEWDDINDQLMDTLVVDEFNFRWGMVPDHFKDVPGYEAAHE